MPRSRPGQCRLLRPCSHSCLQGHANCHPPVRFDRLAKGLPQLASCVPALPHSHPFIAGSFSTVAKMLHVILKTGLYIQTCPWPSPGPGSSATASDCTRAASLDRSVKLGEDNTPNVRYPSRYPTLVVNHPNLLYRSTTCDRIDFSLSRKQTTTGALSVSMHVTHARYMLKVNHACPVPACALTQQVGDFKCPPSCPQQLNQQSAGTLGVLGDLLACVRP